MKGIWIAAAGLLAAGAARAQSIAGDWKGTLKPGPVELRLVLHIAEGDKGTLTGTMDSLDQGAKGIPATAVKRDGADLTIGMKGLACEFKGKIAADVNSIEGTWTQAGNSIPLTVKRSKDGAQLERRRPQNPVKPYPYR